MNEEIASYKQVAHLGKCVIKYSVDKICPDPINCKEKHNNNDQEDFPTWITKIPIQNIEENIQPRYITSRKVIKSLLKETCKLLTNLRCSLCNEDDIRLHESIDSDCMITQYSGGICRRMTWKELMTKQKLFQIAFHSVNKLIINLMRNYMIIILEEYSQTTKSLSNHCYTINLKRTRLKPEVNDGGIYQGSFVNIVHYEAIEQNITREALLKFVTFNGNNPDVPHYDVRFSVKCVGKIKRIDCDVE